MNEKLHTFIILAETENFTKTAEFLNVTQPNVTQHIKKLEEEYRCKLIKRDGRKFKLTEEGKILYRYAKKMLIDEERVRVLLKTDNTSMKCGATLSIADYFLPQYIASYLKKNDANINLYVENTEKLLEKLRKGDLDCAFIEGYFDFDEFQGKSFYNAEFVPAVRAGHPLLNQERVVFEDLFAYPLAIREKGSGTRNILEFWLEDHMISAECFCKVTELGSFVVIKHLVANTDTITFVYKKVVEKELLNKEFVVLPVEDFSIHKELHFVFRRDAYAVEQYNDFYQSIIYAD